MKKLLAIITVAGITAMAGTAIAQDTNTLTVSASVTGSCAFSDATSTLAFGALDPAVGTDVSVSSSTTFWCTKGTGAVSFVDDGGQNFLTKRQMKDTVSGDLLPYDLSLTPDSLANNGPGSERTLTISGTVLGNDYKNVTVGSYSDNVVITINP
ncbi:MAG: spore coat protein U domain-containing protein [Geobacteraceae bacterium]